jgi:parallel beta-helix repeat protein
LVPFTDQAGYSPNRALLLALIILSTIIGLVMPSSGEANLTGPVSVTLPCPPPSTEEADLGGNGDGAPIPQDYPASRNSQSPDAPPHPESGVGLDETAIIPGLAADVPPGSGDTLLGVPDDHTTEISGQAANPPEVPEDESFPHEYHRYGYEDDKSVHFPKTDDSPGEYPSFPAGEGSPPTESAPLPLPSPVGAMESSDENEHLTPQETVTIPPGLPEFSQKSVYPGPPYQDEVHTTFHSGGDDEIPTCLILGDEEMAVKEAIPESEDPHAMVTPTLVSGSSLEEGGWLHITIPGAYLLMADIVHSSPVGILIESSGVTLDGQGHVVTPWNAPYGSQGISIAPVTEGRVLQDIRVSNLSIQGETTGLGLDSLSGSTLEKINLKGNGAGMNIHDSQGLLIQDISASGNTEGVSMVHTSGITMTNSSFTGSVTGIRIESGENDHLSGIAINESRGSGIVITGSKMETITSSSIDGGSVGLSVQNSETCSMEDSLISGTSMFAVSLGTGRDTALKDTIVVNDPGSIGIRARGDNTGTVIDSCQVSGGAYGIVIDRSTGLFINNTRLSRISSDGITMQDSRYPVLRGLNISDTATGFRGLSLQSLEFSDSTIRDSQEAVIVQGLHDGAMNELVVDNCSEKGISVISASGLSMSDNRINNSGTGISIVNSLVNISTSKITGGGVGISMLNSHDAVVLSNTVQGAGSGITMVHGNSSYILGNTLSENTWYGVSIQDSPGVVLSGNRFDNWNNTWIPEKSGGGVIWNATRDPGGLYTPFHGGNTWVSPGGDGYSRDCTDSDQDGYCDTPLPIPGSGYDMLPVALSTPKPIPTPGLPGPGLPGDDNRGAGYSWGGIPGVSSWEGHVESDINSNMVISRYSFEGSMKPGTICLARVSFRNTGPEPRLTLPWVEARFDGFQDLYHLSPDGSSRGAGSTCSFSGPVTLPHSDGPWTLWILLEGKTPSGEVIQAGSPVPIPVVAGKDVLQVQRGSRIFMEE